jgi:hypothetical protein
VRHAVHDYSIFRDYPIKVTGISWYIDKGAEDALAKGGSIAKGVVSTLTVVSLPASASVGILLIKVIQMFDYLTFLNVKSPSNLANFLAIFQ